jgi:hypothetical protein
MMKAIVDNGRPAIQIEYEDGHLTASSVTHVIDLDEARRLRDELTAVIKTCVIEEAVRWNK